MVSSRRDELHSTVGNSSQEAMTGGERRHSRPLAELRLELLTGAAVLIPRAVGIKVAAPCSEAIQIGAAPRSSVIAIPRYRTTTASTGRRTLQSDAGNSVCHDATIPSRTTTTEGTRMNQVRPGLREVTKSTPSDFAVSVGEGVSWTTVRCASNFA